MEKVQIDHGRIRLTRLGGVQDAGNTRGAEGEFQQYVSKIMKVKSGTEAEECRVQVSPPPALIGVPR